MRIDRLVALAAVLAASLGLAAPAARAAPAVWTVDKAASKLGFKSSFSGMDFDGAFRRWDAQIVFDPKALGAAKATVSIDVASASTGTSERDEAMPTSDWFDVAHFPRATFVTKAFRSRGGDRYEAAGDLTLRGVSRPVVLPFTLTIEGDVATMTGQVAVDRSAFGVGQGQWSSPETVPLPVTVTVSITAHRAK